MSHPRIFNSSWKLVLPRLVILLLIVFLPLFVLPLEKQNMAMISGLLVYFLYSIGSRMLIPWYHRKGMRLLQKDQYGKSIDEFKKSVAFFERHPWLDKYRSIVMLSSSGYAYREMALMNIAYVYSQMGEGAKSEEYYKKVLAEYPDNRAVQSALALIEAGRNA